MTLVRILYRSLLPVGVALVVLVGQPVATLLIMQGTVHRQDTSVRLLEPLWFILFLPSVVFDFFVRAFTGSSPGQVFGAYAADVYLGFGLNAVGWALIAGVICVIVQKRLARRSSEPRACVRSDV
jgi:hypothetical protein